VRIFVTGGSGQLGWAVAEVFADTELYLGDHRANDITHPEIIEAISGFKPDVVIHAAAMTDVDECERNREQAFLVNEHGTRYVAQGAEKSGAVMVYISSDYVYDGTKSEPYVETDMPCPVNVYGQSKLAGEQATREQVKRWLIVRTSWVYGSNRKNFVTSVLEWAKSQPVLRLVSDKIGSPSYALDVVRATRSLLEQGAWNHLYHVSGEGSCTWEEYGREILMVAGLKNNITAITFDDLKLPAKRPNNTVLKNAKLAKAGLAMRPWKIALRDFLHQEISPI